MHNNDLAGENKQHSGWPQLLMLICCYLIYFHRISRRAKRAIRNVPCQGNRQYIKNTEFIMLKLKPSVSYTQKKAKAFFKCKWFSKSESLRPHISLCLIVEYHRSSLMSHVVYCYDLDNGLLCCMSFRYCIKLSKLQYVWFYSKQAFNKGHTPCSYNETDRGWWHKFIPHSYRVCWE